MIGIFSKKKSFLKIWSGTPEIHCHVLPAIDDGAKNIEDSKRMLQKYASLGCTTVIATPHTMGGIYDTTIATIKNSFNSISETKEVKLSYASEYMLDDNFERLLSEKKILPLKHAYILVELSYFKPPANLYELLFEISVQRYVPILAHPERYAYYHKNYNVFKELKKKGFLFQLNALSLTDHYGPTCKKIAFKLLEDNLYDFIGIDAHKIGHLEKLSTMKIPSKYQTALREVCINTQKKFL